jgi:hypothetical protein
MRSHSLYRCRRRCHIGADLRPDREDLVGALSGTCPSLGRNVAPQHHEVVMSRSLLGRLVLPLALGATAGCSTPTQPIQLPVSLQTTRIYGSVLPPVSITTAPDTVRITGAIIMNVPCYSFAAAASWRGDTLLVTLAARGKGEACLQVVAAFSYVLTVTSVPSGPVPVRLVYDRYGVPQYLEVAAEQTVQVP